MPALPAESPPCPRFRLHRQVRERARQDLQISLTHDPHVLLRHRLPPFLGGRLLRSRSISTRRSPRLRPPGSSMVAAISGRRRGPKRQRLTVRVSKRLDQGRQEREAGGGALGTSTASRPRDVSADLGPPSQRPGSEGPLSRQVGAPTRRRRARPRLSRAGGARRPQPAGHSTDRWSS